MSKLGDKKRGAANILSFLGLLLVVGFSSISVSSLNPVLINPNMSIGSVAGISSLMPVNISILEDVNSDFIVNKIETYEENVISSYRLNSPTLSQGIHSQKAFKLVNPNNGEVNFKVNFKMPNELKGKVKAYLKDSRDTLIMFTQERSYGAKTVTLRDLEERNFNFIVEVEDSINEPVEFVITFTHG